MKIVGKITALGMLWCLFAFVPGALAEDLSVAKLSAVLAEGQSKAFWQIPTDEVAEWIKQKKTDFVVVDVRPNPADYAAGHIPGSIQISVQDILKPENLAKLPKNKKLVLVCVTGQVQNLPIVILRAMGYDANTMPFGYVSWLPGSKGTVKMQEAVKNAEAKKFPMVK